MSTVRDEMERELFIEKIRIISCRWEARFVYYESTGYFFKKLSVGICKTNLKKYTQGDCLLFFVLHNRRVLPKLQYSFPSS